MLTFVSTSGYDDYVAALNNSFPGWGGRDRLAWVLRPFNGRVHEIFTLARDGVPVAGTILSYREVEVAGVTHVVAIMTGSWTDPGSRGRGLFTAMIDHCSNLGQAGGAAALLAFVTSDNASRRRLESAGSQLVPTWYVSTPLDQTPAWDTVAADDGTLSGLEERRRLEAGPRCRFAYPHLADFRSQLLDRSRNTMLVRSASGQVAAVEVAGRTVRVLAAADSRALPVVTDAVDVFTMTADPNVASSCRNSGARVTDGFVTALPLVPTWPAPTEWFVESGDRI